jgi:hypothetical protein
MRASPHQADTPNRTTVRRTDSDQRREDDLQAVAQARRFILRHTNVTVLPWPASDTDGARTAYITHPHDDHDCEQATLAKETIDALEAVAATVDDVDVCLAPNGGATRL